MGQLLQPIQKKLPSTHYLNNFSDNLLAGLYGTGVFYCLFYINMKCFKACSKPVKVALGVTLVMRYSCVGRSDVIGLGMYHAIMATRPTQRYTM
jgi:hypothetical protein